MTFDALSALKVAAVNERAKEQESGRCLEKAQVSLKKHSNENKERDEKTVH